MELDIQAESIEEAAKKAAKAHSMHLEIVARDLAEGTLTTYHFYRGKRYLGTISGYSYTIATGTYHLSIF